MAKQLFLFYLFLLEMVILGCASSISPEAYWRLKLPYTPMPKFILNSLAPAPVEQPGRAEAFEGVQPSAKESIASIKGYIGSLFYRKSSLKSLNPQYLSYDKQGLDSNNPNYLSYNKQESISTNSYGGLIANNKNGLHSENPNYLSYNKQESISTNSYGGFIANNKNGLHSENPNYLSYNKQESISTNSYGGLIANNKNGLHSENPNYLSYNKQESISTNQFGGVDANEKNGPASENPKYLSYNELGLDTNGYDGLLSYDYKKKHLNSNIQKLLANNKLGLDTNGYDGLLSYAYEKKNLDSNNQKQLSNNEEALSQVESSHVDDKNTIKDQVFFVEKDLHLGTRKTLHFQKSTSKSMILSREVSNQIPFQSNKIPEILQILSLDPKSKEADVLSKRIELCEEPTIEGVEKKCVTSLESMVDYVISMIGTNVKALTTQVEKDSKMEYTIKGVKRLVKNDHETVVCHKSGYPYALFFCHRTTTIRSYLVTLVGKDGSKIEAVAACHKESNDVLDNYAKNVLKVEPGSTHICHFPPVEDTIIWVPKN